MDCQLLTKILNNFKRLAILYLKITHEKNYPLLVSKRPEN